VMQVSPRNKLDHNFVFSFPSEKRLVLVSFEI
jgi:hypothetical protein